MSADDTVMARVEARLDSVAQEQKEQRDLLIRIDERYSGLATRVELHQLGAELREALQPIAAQAVSAHSRLDGFEIDMDEHDKRLKVLELAATTEAGRKDARAPIGRLLTAIITGVLVSAATAGTLILLHLN